MKSVDLLVYRQYEFRNTKFIVEINRIKKTVSFVEYEEGKFKPMRWRFTDRELKYMNGWLLILKGMMEVTEQLKKELDVFAKEDTEDLLHVLMRIGEVSEEELV